MVRREEKIGGCNLKLLFSVRQDEDPNQGDDATYWIKMLILIDIQCTRYYLYKQGYSCYHYL